MQLNTASTAHPSQPPKSNVHTQIPIPTQCDPRRVSKQTLTSRTFRPLKMPEFASGFPTNKCVLSNISPLMSEPQLLASLYSYGTISSCTIHRSKTTGESLGVAELCFSNCASCLTLKAACDANKLNLGESKNISCILYTAALNVDALLKQKESMIEVALVPQTKVDTPQPTQNTGLLHYGRMDAHETRAWLRTNFGVDPHYVFMLVNCPTIEFPLEKVKSIFRDYPYNKIAVNEIGFFVSFSSEKDASRCFVDLYSTHESKSSGARRSSLHFTVTLHGRKIKKSDILRSYPTSVIRAVTERISNDFRHKLKQECIKGLRQKVVDLINQKITESKSLPIVKEEIPVEDNKRKLLSFNFNSKRRIEVPVQRKIEKDLPLQIDGSSRHHIIPSTSLANPTSRRHQPVSYKNKNIMSNGSVTPQSRESSPTLKTSDSTDTLRDIQEQSSESAAQSDCREASVEPSRNIYDRFSVEAYTEEAGNFFPMISNRPNIAITDIDFEDQNLVIKRFKTNFRPDHVLHRINLALQSDNETSAIEQQFLIENQNLEYATRNIIVARSAIHAWGLFAGEDINRSDFILEYIGEIIRSGVADVRELQYELEGIDSTYFFRNSDDTVIDATKQGNAARLMNHSCDPNCAAGLFQRKDGIPRIGLFASRKIKKGEELTFNYHFTPAGPNDSRLICNCGSEKCVKYLT